MNKKIIKTLCGILFNISGAYLLFYPQYYFIAISKIVGVVGLLFSYYIFYLDTKKESLNCLLL